MIDPNPQTLILVAIGSFLIALLLALALRSFIARLLRRFNRRPRQSDLHRERLLDVMGQRMGRLWMPQELSTLTGYAPDIVERYLAAAKRKKMVVRSWERHPVTDEEYLAAHLSPLGIQRHGMYAPSGSVAPPVRHEDLTLVDLNDFVVDTRRTAKRGDLDAESEDGQDVFAVSPPVDEVWATEDVQKPGKGRPAGFKRRAHRR